MRSLSAPASPVASPPIPAPGSLHPSEAPLLPAARDDGARAPLWGGIRGPTPALAPIPATRPTAHLADGLRVPVQHVTQSAPEFLLTGAEAMGAHACTLGGPISHNRIDGAACGKGAKAVVGIKGSQYLIIGSVLRDADTQQGFGITQNFGVPGSDAGAHNAAAGNTMA